MIRIFSELVLEPVEIIVPRTCFRCFGPSELKSELLGPTEPAEVRSSGHPHLNLRGWRTAVLVLFGPSGVHRESGTKTYTMALWSPDSHVNHGVSCGDERWFFFEFNT